MGKDLTGKVFGKLTVLKKDDKKSGKYVYWLCKCECGRKTSTRTYSLLNKEAKTCGCGKKYHSFTHGMSETDIYQKWTSMKARCSTKVPMFVARSYSLRGIKVCKRWHRFENFLKDMGDTYKPGLTLDRIDNNKGYNKSNCRWTTPYIQRINKRNTTLVEHNGETHSLRKWCELLNISYSTSLRKAKLGVDPKQLLGFAKTTP